MRPSSYLPEELADGSEWGWARPRVGSQEGVPPEGWWVSSGGGILGGGVVGVAVTNRVDPIAWGRRPPKSQANGDGSPAVGKGEG